MAFGTGSDGRDGGTFTKLMMSIIAVLITAGVVGLWNLSSNVAVLATNQENLRDTVTTALRDIKDDMTDREARVRRLERLVIQQNRQRMDDRLDGDNQ